MGRQLFVSGGSSFPLDHIRRRYNMKENNETFPYLNCSTYDFGDLGFLKNFFVYKNKQIPNSQYFTFDLSISDINEFFLKQGFEIFYKRTTHKHIIEEKQDVEDIIYISYIKDNDFLIYCDIEYDDRYKRKIVGLCLVYAKSKKEYAQFIAQEILKLPRLEKVNNNRINIIISNNGKLDLLTHEINFNKIDVDLSYNDDFKPVDELVLSSLRNNKKGIILFHGEPGCGKTSYIRHISSQIDNRKIIFLPPNMSNELSSPGFISLLIEYKNSILVIEDAENVIKSRKSGQSQSISNLLNISDGLLSDILNISIVATFNCQLGDIDEALMRKGRLVCRYEFKKLAKEKAQKLSDSLGYKNEITQDMTLANIYNQDKDSYVEERKSIGFFN